MDDRTVSVSSREYGDEVVDIMRKEAGLSPTRQSAHFGKMPKRKTFIDKKP